VGKILNTRVFGGRDAEVRLASGNEASAIDTLDGVDVGDGRTIFTSGCRVAEGRRGDASAARLQITRSINTVITAVVISSSYETTNGFTGGAGRILRCGRLGTTALRVVTTATIANSFRERADALGGVVFVIWNETVFAMEIAWSVEITERITMIRVTALFLMRVAVDEIREIVVSLVFT